MAAKNFNKSKGNLCIREAAKERRAEKEEEKSEETEESAKTDHGGDGSARCIAPTRGVDNHSPFGGKIGGKHDRRRRFRRGGRGGLRRGGVGRERDRFQKEGTRYNIYIDKFCMGRFIFNENK